MTRFEGVFVLALASFISVECYAAQPTPPDSQTDFDTAFAKQFHYRDGLIRGVGSIVGTDSPYRFLGDSPEFAVRKALEATEDQSLAILRALPPKQPVALYLVLPTGLDDQVISMDLRKRVERSHLLGELTQINPRDVDAVIGRFRRNNRPYVLVNVSCTRVATGFLATANTSLRLESGAFQRATTGVALERSDIVPSVARTAMICFAICLANGLVVLLFSQNRKIPRRKMIRLFALSIVTFLCGAVGQLALLKTLHAFAPSPDSLPELDLMWVAGLGYATFLAPAAVAWRFVSANRFAKLIAMSTESKWIVAPAATMGACAVLTVPFLVIFPTSMVVLALGIGAAFAIATLCNLLMQGRIQRSAGTMAIMVLPAAWAMALSTANASLFFLTAGVGFAFIMLLRDHDQSSGTPAQNVKTKTTSTDHSSFRPLLPSERLTFEHPATKAMIRCVRSHLQSQASAAIEVRGSDDATAMAFLQLDNELQNEGVLVVWLEGQPNLEPLEPWTQSIERLFPELESSELSGGWAEIPVDSIAASASLIASQIPFRLPELDFFSLAEDRIVAALGGVDVALIIPDARQLDEASVRMVSRIQQRLQRQKNGIVVLSDEPMDLKSDGRCSHQVFDVPELSVNDIQNQLVARLRVDHDTARRIVRAVPRTVFGQTGRSFTKHIAEYVDFLQQAGALIREPKTAFLSDRYADELPLPELWTNSIGSQIAGLSDRQRLCLSLVACIAKPVDAHFLGLCLDDDEITLLAELHHLVESGLLAECDVEFRYRFASSAMLSETRSALGIRNGDQDGISHLQRELHYRIYQALQKTTHANDVLGLARHAFGAGERTAQQAIGLNLAAAQFALQSHSYHLSREFIRAADDRARTTGMSFDIQRHLLLVEMQQSHVQQARLEETADKAIQFSKSCEDLQFMIKAARACYDASKYESGERFRTACTELSLQVSNSTSVTRSLRAEAMQFLALADRDRFKRLSRFRQAIGQLGNPTDGHEKSLLARLLCSFADELIRQQTDLETARSHYQRSLRLRRESAVPDENGIARVYGGLGRTEYLSENYQAAKEWFTKDLHIVKKLYDARRQCMMHSWIGCCLLREGEVKQAIESFDKSLELSDNDFETFYAVSGLLVALHELGSRSRCQAATKQLLSVTGGIEGLRKLIDWSPISDELVHALRESKVAGLNDLKPIKRKRTRPRRRDAA